jgi:RimJ/RimL family protein N-acetyltransferase
VPLGAERPPFSRLTGTPRKVHVPDEYNEQAPVMSQPTGHESGFAEAESDRMTVTRAPRFRMTPDSPTVGGVPEPVSGRAGSVAPTVALDWRNRSGAAIRTVTPEDESSILEFWAGLCDDSRRPRFFSAGVDLRGEAHRGAADDDVDHHGLLAIAPEGGVVGHASYVRVPGSEWAEVAVEVAEDLHSRGLVTALLIRLAQSAESRQIRCFFAEVLPENRAMLTIFRDHFGARTLSRGGEVDVLLATSSWRRAQAGPQR